MLVPYEIGHCLGGAGRGGEGREGGGGRGDGRDGQEEEIHNFLVVWYHFLQTLGNMLFSYTMFFWEPSSGGCNQ